MSLLLTWTYLTPCSSISIVNFEHAIPDWILLRILPDYEYPIPIQDNGPSYINYNQLRFSDVFGW